MSEQTGFSAAAFTALGTPREKVSLPASPFDGTVNMPVMHLAVKAYLANQRQATAFTKTRGLVIGGNQKPWKQKGTGRARQGSIRAPNWPGGGTVFGPHGDRNYEQTIPRKVRQLARRSAFNARAREASIYVVDNFNYETPGTKTLRSLLDRMGLGGAKVLVLTNGVKPAVHLSGRNLSDVHVMPYGDVSTYHILWSDAVVIEGAAIGHDLPPVAEEPAGERPAARKATKVKAAAEPPKETPSAARKSTKAVAKKKAARKATRAKAKAAPRTAAKKKPAAAKKKPAARSVRKKGS
ncbi:MAG: 50S ribosomal protein L4 [Gemmatimonadota bacterium]